VSCAHRYSSVKCWASLEIADIYLASSTASAGGALIELELLTKVPGPRLPGKTAKPGADFKRQRRKPFTKKRLFLWLSGVQLYHAFEDGDVKVVRAKS
jgi:hypothetical protein